MLPLLLALKHVSKQDDEHLRDENDSFYSKLRPLDENSRLSGI